MSSSGLRERKKQKTRWAIQEHALRLFAEQGYEATTIDQIAAAAEISPSTFFRYFPTKEDLVIQDPYDEMLAEGLRNAPAELSAIAAIRATLRDAFDQMGPQEQVRVLERTRLTMSVPALRAKSLENFLSTLAILREAIGARTGRDPEDLAVRVVAGAIIGAFVSTLELWSTVESPDLRELFDRTLAQLEAGLEL
jgi:AcrR family transcriptional regulator